MNIDQINSLFFYDSDSGLLYWKASGRGRIKKKSAGTILSSGYIGILIDGKRYFAHRIAWAIHHGKWPDLQIDHINGIRTDNRICNLREASNSQNGKNLPLSKANTSGIKGVSFDKTNNKWRAFIRVDGTNINLGRFVQIEDAAKVRRMAEKQYFGEWNRNV